MKIWTLETYDPSTLPNWVNENYEKILPYVTNFLTSKHPHRNGIMCPFVPKAIKQDTMHFTFFNGEKYKDDPNLIKKCIRHFKENIGTGTGATIIIFQENFSIHELLAIHIKHKIECIKNFIMLGALYENNSAPSLHCADYYPLRTPTPSLVLRNITSSDLTFLEPEHYSPFAKSIFLSAFIKRFSIESASSKFAATQVSLAISARRKQYLSIVSKTIITTILMSLVAAVIYKMVL